MKLKTALIAILFTPIYMVSQNFPFTVMTVKDGLPANDIYAITQDADGYMWFGCSNALVRYDGYRLNTYTEKDGLITGAVSALHADEYGRLWIGHGRQGISVYENGKFRPFSHDSTGTNYVSSLLSLGKENLLALHSGNSIRVLSTSDGHEIVSDGKAFGHAPYCMTIDSNGEICIGGDECIYGIDTKNALIQERMFPGVKILSMTLSEDGDMLYGTDKGVVEVYNQGIGYFISIPQKETSRINHLLNDQYNTTWVFDALKNSLDTYEGESENWIEGIHNPSIRDIKELPTTHVSACTGGYNSAVNAMFEDREGNVWVAFSGQGLFKFYDRHVLNFSDSDGLTINYLTTVMNANDGTLHVGSMDGLFVLDDKKQLQKIDAVEGRPEFIKQILQTRNDEILVATSSGDFRTTPEKIYPIQHGGINYNFISANNISSINNELYSARWDAAIRKIQIENSVNVADSILLIGVIEKDHKVNVVKSLNGGLICGTVKGLVRVFENGKTKLYNGVFDGIGVNDIQVCRNGRIAICANDGLYIFNSEADVDAQKFSKFEGHCYLTIDEDGDDNLWVGTDNGLLAVNPEMKLREFSVDDGIASNNINDVFYDSSTNEIFLATANGLSVVDPTRLLNNANKDFELHIHQVLKNDTLSISANDISLGEKFESLKFLFSTNTFTGNHHKQFSYKLNDGGWQKLSIPEISITNWNYGKNEVVLRVEDSLSGAFSEKNLVVNVYVPVLRREPVQAASIALLAILVFALFRYRMGKVRKANQQKIEQVNYIHHLRQQAVSASLNPHFIFNCLNSIQYFVNKGDADKADQYLVGFSRLVRFNLDNGNKEFISLHDEMEYLKRYADLENLRMSGTLKFNFDLDESINPITTKIPTFVIQPFVENAFRHAFEQKQNPKAVSIRIRKVENKLAVTVTDNGKGILDNSSAKDPGHNSSGIELVRQKLNLLNDKYGLKCTVEIHDLREEKTLAKGTEVGIVLDGVEKFSRAA